MCSKSDIRTDSTPISSVLLQRLDEKRCARVRAAGVREPVYRLFSSRCMHRCNVVSHAYLHKIGNLISYRMIICTKEISKYHEGEGFHVMSKNHKSISKLYFEICIHVKNLNVCRYNSQCNKTVPFFTNKIKDLYVAICIQFIVNL